MLAAGPTYRERDRTLATMFAEAAAEARLDRIVLPWWSGVKLVRGLSDHLASRREVEAALAFGFGAGNGLARGDDHRFRFGFV